MAGQLTVDTLKASSGVLATQNGMTGIAKAWINFNGSTAVINGSFNVSSVTRNGTGDYTITFTTSMSNANFSWAGSQQPSTDTNGWLYEVYTGINTRVSTAVRVIVRNSAATLIDPNIVSVSVFGA